MQRVSSGSRGTGCTLKGARSPKRTKPSQAEIAERAYFIYLHDGCSDELENWVRAERELTAA